jgi:hypothetical protein
MTFYIREDDLAGVIYEKARDLHDWTIGILALVAGGVVRFERSRPNDGLVVVGEMKGHARSPSDLVVLSAPDGQQSYVTPIQRKGYHYELEGWSYISGVPAHSLIDRTAATQLHLNRLRRNEEILRLNVNRGSAGRARAAAYFKPDISRIVESSGVTESNVRAFFDGKEIDWVVREQLLAALGVYPEELEIKQWAVKR